MATSKLVRWTTGLAIVSLASLLQAVAGPPQLLHATLSEKTARAFDSYMRKAEEKNARSLSSGKFLWIDDQDKPAVASAYERLKRGEVLIERTRTSDPEAEIPGGLVHDWEELSLFPAES